MGMLMAMICRELLGLSSLKNIKVVAGEKGLDRIVRWVYVAECFEDNRQIVDWLYGGELVIITGRDVRDNETFLLELLKLISQKKVSGLVINIGPYIKEIPHAVTSLADELAMPVLTIPWETKLVEATREICSTILIREKEEKSANSILENILLSEELEADSLIERAANYGYDLTGDCMMCIIEICNFQEYIKQHGIKDEGTLLAVKTNIIRILTDIFIHNNKKALTMLRNDSVMILLKAQTNDFKILNSIAAQAENELAQKFDGLTIVVGLGNSYPSLSDQRKSLKEAEQALKIARLSQTGRILHQYKDMGIYSILLNVKDRHVLEHYYQELLGELIEYDRINSSELISTLDAYLKENGNITMTAEKMFIHRNTLKYRINKIEEIALCDLRRLDDMIKLEIGLMIGRYLKEFH